jgi:FAD/FMN-containing dehydrogenase
LAIVLKIVTTLKSTFAVRSSGHMANPGFSGVGNSGVLLDLTALNEVILSPHSDYASVGPGARWEQVYAELEKHDLTVVGGRVADVGVGGLILGGLFSTIGFDAMSV